MLDLTNKTLEQIYSQIPNIDCKEGCSDCCGPALQFPIENQNIKRYLFNRNQLAKVHKTIDCPYLKDNKCTIYPVRPIICRLFGVVLHLRLTCRHVVPSKLLTNEQAERLIKATENIDVGLIW